MKKIYFGLGLSLISLAALSQPTLNGECNPVVNQITTFHTVENDAAVPGSAGANVTWDFSQLTTLSSVSAKRINGLQRNCLFIGQPWC